MDFLNFGLKFKFSDKNQVELMPNKSNLAKKWPFPGEFQSSSEFQEDSRNDGILEFHIEIQVPSQKLSGKDTLYIEIDKNKPNLGNSRISGCLDSRFEKSRDAPKSAHNHSIKLDLYQMCQI